VNTSVTSVEVGFDASFSLHQSIIQGTPNNCDRYAPTDVVTFGSRLSFNSKVNIQMDAYFNGIIPNVFSLEFLTLGDMRIGAGVMPAPPYLMRIALASSVALGRDCIKVTWVLSSPDFFFFFLIRKP
jgi:hypothetical protein